MHNTDATLQHPLFTYRHTQSYIVRTQLQLPPHPHHTPNMYDETSLWTLNGDGGETFNFFVSVNLYMQINLCFNKNELYYTLEKPPTDDEQTGAALILSFISRFLLVGSLLVISKLASTSCLCLVVSWLVFCIRVIWVRWLLGVQRMDSRVIQVRWLFVLSTTKCLGDIGNASGWFWFVCCVVHWAKYSWVPCI